MTTASTLHFGKRGRNDRLNLWGISVLLLLHEANTQMTEDFMIQYSFSPESCDNGLFYPEQSPFHDDVPPLPFYRNTASTACSRGMGVESQLMNDMEHGDSLEITYVTMVKNDTKKLLQHLETQNQGISVEMWIKPKNHTVQQDGISSIFSIGKQAMHGLENAPTSCDREQFDLQLAEVREGDASIFQLTFRSSHPWFEPCTRYVLNDIPIQHDHLIHVVMTFADGEQQIFVNGQSVMTFSEPFRNDLGHWGDYSDDDTFGMGFFGGKIPNEDPWVGKIYQFSLYDHPLTATEVLQNFDLGVSIPTTVSPYYALNYEVTINEDAEILANSHEPEWYSLLHVPIPGDHNSTSDYQKIALQVGSVADDIQPPTGNGTVSPTASPPSMLVFITSLPNRGRLYHTDGTTFPDGNDTSRIAIPVQANEEQVFEVVYLPPPHEHSPLPGMAFASFQYCVTDRVIFDPLQCEPAQISIVVDAVNDPPLARADPLELFVSEDFVETDRTPSIEIGGYDVFDQGDGIASIQISRPPKYGDLMLRVGTFRDDAIPHGTLLSSLNYTVSTIHEKDGPQSIFVKYLLNEESFLSTDTIVRDSIVSDSFAFRVSDRRGTWSAEKNVLLQVESSVEAKTQTNLKNHQSRIQLYGHDKSAARRPIGFFIESIPAEGQLYEGDTLNALRPGSLISYREGFPYNEGANLTFTPSTSFCRSEGLREFETTFLYRVVALSPNDKVSSVSKISSHTIQAKCQNIFCQELALVVPNKVFHVKQTTVASQAKVVMANDTRRDEVVTLEGLQVLVENCSENRMSTVTVLPGKGYITFDETFWHKVHQPVRRGRRVMAAGNITFEARMNTLDDILRDLRFQSLHVGNDTIQILIQKNCDSSEDRSNCLVIHEVIHVMVEELKEQPLSTTLIEIGFEWQVLVCWLGYPLLYLMMFVIPKLYAAKTKSSKEGTPSDDESMTPVIVGISKGDDESTSTGMQSSPADSLSSGSVSSDEEDVKDWTLKGDDESTSTGMQSSRAESLSSASIDAEDAKDWTPESICRVPSSVSTFDEDEPRRRRQVDPPGAVLRGQDDTLDEFPTDNGASQVAEDVL